MFRIIQPNSFYVDANGSLCKILRTKSDTVHYQRNGHNCIASMMRFQHDFEFVDGAELKQIWDDLETTAHIKSLRAMQRVA
ncbi:DUF4222 domain-containing protein [Lelliottia amnigena]|uniref:DUF4222 domain-containing protein n=1 Tax=Lelliottia amnigena TaxID=61646 RepID=UPI0020906DD6|nr:DUF4222 domain-containing protein [Lelliottia amnigena]USR61581.1 DUF4222 domain-containing protein [Lelliottia amnigena]